jgi:hypothetical protein
LKRAIFDDDEDDDFISKKKPNKELPKEEIKKEISQKSTKGPLDKAEIKVIAAFQNHSYEEE